MEVVAKHGYLSVSYLSERDVERSYPFLDHTNQHIMDEIKKSHPDWVVTDGICRKCADYLKSQLKK
jgi:folate-dependent phosphoribosylglycinamide formyltransferase PurN